jgi:hypothetical protein
VPDPTTPADLFAVIVTTALILAAFVILGSRVGAIFELPWRLYVAHRARRLRGRP